VWFYYKVSLLQTPQRGKSVFGLSLNMTPLDYATEPSFECIDNESSDTVFIRVVGFIGGRDAVEEYLACRMFPLSANFSFA
jgi:hypothetical protein